MFVRYEMEIVGSLSRGVANGVSWWKLPCVLDDVLAGKVQLVKWKLYQGRALCVLVE